MKLNDIIEKLKPHWLSFIIVSIVLAIEQILATLWVIFYLNLDVVHGDTAQMAIQMFNWMNSDVNIFSKLYKLSQDIGNLWMPLLFIGIYLYFLNRERKVDDAHADTYEDNTMTPEAEKKRDNRLRSIEKRVKNIREGILLLMLIQLGIIIIIIASSPR